MQSFDWIKEINAGTGKDLEVTETYVKYLTTRAFSYHIDTLPIANYLNEYPEMDSQMHYDFLQAMVTPAKRFSKWFKPEKHSDAYVLSLYFGIALKHAYMYVDLFTEEQIIDMREQLDVSEK